MLFAPADGLPGLVAAGGGDGAGVDDVSIGRAVEVHQMVAPADKLGLHGLGLILIGLTAQGVDGDIHKNILSCAPDFCTPGMAFS